MTVRRIIFFAIFLFALVWGAVLALPTAKKEYARVEIKGVSVVAEIADSPSSVAQGLSGRVSLDRSAGMLLAFEEPDYHRVWMKGMNFPLDILWIRNGMVSGVLENVPVPAPSANVSALHLYSPEFPADLALEVNAGFIKSNGIKIGDPVKIASNSGVIPKNEPTPGEEYFISTLKQKKFNGYDFKISALVSANKYYEKYLISYKSARMTVGGIMNVPLGLPPYGGYPVLVLNHGRIPKEAYFPGRGSSREQDFFSRNGYVTIHPDYRGLGNSSAAPSDRYDFYVGYSEDVINLLEALKKSRPTGLNLDKIGMWGHSMGGAIASKIMVLRDDIKAYALFAPASAVAEDNFYKLAAGERARLDQTYGQNGPEIYKKISPYYYFADVSSPVQIHHGTADAETPLSFSKKIFDELMRQKKTVEFFTYGGQGHEFIEDWPLAANRVLQFFDKYVK